MQLFKILIASNRSKYDLQLAEALNNIFGDICTIKTPAKETIDQLSPMVFDLCFISPNQIENLNSYIDKNTVFYFFCTNSITTSSEDKNITWPASISTIANIIKQYLSKHKNYTINHKPLLPNKANLINGASKTKNLIYMYLNLNGESSDFVKEKMLEQLSEGILVYYLPLMPSYLMKLICTPDNSGPDLSELLLSIHQNCSPDPDKIGIFTQMHPAGYLQFRPPKRSDDIISCNPEIIKNVIDLAKQKLDNSAEKSILWVDCRYIPINMAAKIVVFSDYLFLDISDQNFFYCQEARRELGNVLHDLSTHTIVTECKNCD